MSDVGLDFCMQLQHAQARLQWLLDDALGTQHGLSLADFTLLQALARAERPGAGLAPAELVGLLGVPASAVLRRLVPLEKIGLVARAAVTAPTPRQMALRPAGLRLLREAEATAAQVCGQMLAGLPARALATTGKTLAALAAGARRAAP